MTQVNNLFSTRKTVVDRTEELELVTTEKFAGLDIDFYRSGDDVFMTRNQIGEALGYAQPQRAMNKIHQRNKERLDKFSAVVKLGTTDGKAYDTHLYNERGIYEILRKSNQPKADEFYDFVYDIIEGLRKGNLKVVPSHEIEDPLERAKQWIKEEEERRELETANERMKPYAVLGESVSDNDTLITIGELAKIMKQRGIDIGQNRLFEWMRQEGYLIKRKGSTYNLPTQRSLDMKLFHVVKREINKGGEVAIARTTKVTGKGQVYFLKKMVELTYENNQRSLPLFDA